LLLPLPPLRLSKRATRGCRQDANTP
jgi:hypothetical protein